MSESNINEYFSGSSLIGNNYSIDQITEWYNDEKEGYAGLVQIDLKDDHYPYQELNWVHGFKYLPANIKTQKVLGIGSAFGQEFEPIVDNISELTIIEPSDELFTEKIGAVKPQYIKPTVAGKIDFPDNTFDLITSFGVLHHIPNVSFVLNEILRVLKPGGYFLLREPIVSMGDWREPRLGLTKRERGIPVHVFEDVFSKNKVEILNKNYLTCMTSFIQSKLGFIASKKLISYRAYIVMDKFLASLLSWNIRYHHVKFHHKLAPQNVAYVIKKTS